MIMTVFKKKVPANLVPAAAVIREGQALFEITGRKEFVDCIISYLLKIKINFKKTFNTILLELNYKRIEFYEKG